MLAADNPPELTAARERRHAADAATRTAGDRMAASSDRETSVGIRGAGPVGLGPGGARDLRPHHPGGALAFRRDPAPGPRGAQRIGLIRRHPAHCPSALYPRTRAAAGRLGYSLSGWLRSR